MTIRFATLLSLNPRSQHQRFHDTASSIRLRVIYLFKPLLQQNPDQTDRRSFNNHVFHHNQIYTDFNSRFHLLPSQHFIVGSLRHPTLLSVSDAGVINTLVSDDSIPANSSFLGITVDIVHNRILAVVHSHSQPSNSALAAYDLRSPHHRLFLSALHDTASTTTAPAANDVTFDFSGNAFVTNSASNFIWKVDLEGNLYKVDSEDGTARKIQLNKELNSPDGIAFRRDGVLVVVSKEKLYFIKSDNSWSDGVVYDETALDAERFATSVTVGAEDRVYVLYGHVDEGIMGNSQRDEFSILEISNASALYKYEQENCIIMRAFNKSSNPSDFFDGCSFCDFLEQILLEKL
ncbi:unnamed protein product [Lactuca saligna]|uniref:Six-bladed beta-propeller, TolB-like protein n=1 Tax=Lactuca saligna TaxID=75948 RepID=A0AA36E1E7_LACSI|nr:unnamed protein product [Lactuca saligna]